FYCPQTASAPIRTQQSQRRVEDCIRPKDGYTTRWREHEGEKMARVHDRGVRHAGIAAFVTLLLA
ncbi:TPA: hypothetical protein ACY5F3_004331, partial [Aeromonas hydrophila]